MKMTRLKVNETNYLARIYTLIKSEQISRKHLVPISFQYFQTGLNMQIIKKIKIKLIMI